MHKKKGDTLIEVALAIGIFSMVAIVVVSVISSSTSGAQSALETTITREELDAQAEALRFIHDSYIIGSQSADTSENPYAMLWDEIKKHAITESNAGLTNTPKTCSDLYDSEGGGKYHLKNTGTRKQFVINTRQLSSPNTPDKIVISATNSWADSHFAPPATYPRILYGSTVSNNEEALYNQTENTTASIKRVEGIYIIAVKGTDHKIISGSTAVANKLSYYDFYIRSCWMPPGEDRASTISTVVRLYDPAAITY